MRKEEKLKARRKGKIYLFEWRVPKNSRERLESLLSDQCKEIEGKSRMGKTRDLFKKIIDTKGTFNAPTLGREKPKARKNSTL